ncbi:MAG: hypothetical protein HKO57_12050 [Akkermansiaceae bacterium]|nr:hypothetical protein [Akkermansiaceae bacterium]
MKSALVSLIFIAAGIAGNGRAGAEERAWSDDIIYFAMTDRFFDGDAGNNVPRGSEAQLYDRAQRDLDRYHGGDLRGLEKALQSGYFTDLGVTALWITPPVKNVWNSRFDVGDAAKTGYHGYWTQDFSDLDPHLTSLFSLDGRKYPAGKEGRLQHYRDFVALAHAKGIKVIQDIVCNHTGPVFYYDADGDGEFDRGRKEEWIQPFREAGFHGNARWAHEPAWNQLRTGPEGVLSQLGTYTRKGYNPGSLGKNDGEEVLCDFFSLRDIQTAPDSPHFDALVDEFVRIYAPYIEDIGVDGFRIDTVKHVHHEFWTAFAERLRKRLGEKAGEVILFGEAYDGNPEVLGRYTYRSDWARDKRPCLDGLLNFQFCWSARGYLRHAGRDFGNAAGLERSMRDLHGGPEGGARPYYNPEPGADGLNARQKSITFIENHDGLNRFRVRGVSERRNILANAMVLTTEGIPCLYYGTEAGLEARDGELGRDSETGRLTFVERGAEGRFAKIRKSGSFAALSGLIAARKGSRALREGRTGPLWVDSGASQSDDGVFVFARYLEDRSEVVVVAFNLSGRERTAGLPENAMAVVGLQNEALVKPGQELKRVPLEDVNEGARAETAELQWDGAVPRVVLTLPAESVTLWRVE